MNDKSDFIPISTVEGLKVTSREDSSQNQYNQQNRKKHNRQNDEREIHRDIELLSPDELMEYGSIILNKRNTELKLFNNLKAKHSAETDVDLKHEIEANLFLLEKKIAMYDSVLQRLELKRNELPIEEHNPDLDIILSYISNLLEHYKTFLAAVKDENKILNAEDIDFLENVIKQKDEILDRIDNTRKHINFDVFNKLSPKNKKKIKADKILSDIHNIVSEIISQEDENRVELLALSEQMKLEIKRQDRGVKAISQFTPAVTKSHFIDTKK